jgi:hypothetical protein
MDMMIHYELIFHYKIKKNNRLKIMMTTHLESLGTLSSFLSLSFFSGGGGVNIHLNYINKEKKN